MKSDNPNGINIITEEEMDALIESAVLGGATKAECEKLIEWANRVKVNYITLRALIDGNDNVITVQKDGSPKFLRKRTPKEKSK